jgi:hypothetical protein
MKSEDMKSEKILTEEDWIMKEHVEYAFTT